MWRKPSGFHELEYKALALYYLNIANLKVRTPKNRSDAQTSLPWRQARDAETSSA